MASWHSVETANFRILNFGARPVTAETTAACERLREQIVGCWLEGTAEAWSPKCTLVLHPTDSAYIREVGPGGRNTVASSLVDRKQGRIASRRVDIRATQANWQTTALGHELTHIVLADRFAQGAIPRWVDEGVALMADPPEKRHQHAQDLKRSLAVGSHFRALELITLGDYPAPERWGAFYGQSLALVEYLVDRSGHQRFLEFVEMALDRGYEPALREKYDLTVADLELQWRSKPAGSPRKVAAAPAAKPVIHPVSFEQPIR